MTFVLIFFRPIFPHIPQYLYPVSIIILPLTLVSFFALFGHDTTLFPP
jgi:hypothetical protein